MSSVIGHRRRILFLIFIMAAVAVGVAGITLLVMYRAALEEERERLIVTARSEARLMEAVARFDAQFSAEAVPEGAFAATIGQIRDAHDRYAGFGETGEFTLAKREGDQIVFLLSHRHLDLENPRPVPFSSRLAEPMRRAVSGESGTVVGVDYRGETVLAAYEHVAVLHVGLVAKIDLTEIRAPFIRTGLLASLGALALISIGVVLFRRIGDPLVRRLEQSEERLSAFNESATEGFLLFDSALNLLEINSAGLKILGMDRKDMVGKNMVEIAPNIKEVGRYDQYVEVLRTGEPSYAEDLVPDAKFGKIHLSLTAFRVGNGLGIIFSDITERKRAEEELQKHREHLEELVTERTTELEATNKELETFAYSVSHDLRGPLRAIDGFSRILQEEIAEQLDAEGRRLLGVVRENTGLMGQLIEDVLELSRVGRRALAPTHVDMNEVVAAALHQLEQQHPDRELGVTVPELPPAIGDERLIQQVWSNLLSNAVKFTTERDVAVIQVLGAVKDSENVYAVRDNGVGFDMQYSGKLFGLFQRLHARDEFEGTGVGLAIVKRIVQRHGGRVWAEGQVNEGATFYFALPNDGGTAP